MRKGSIGNRNGCGSPFATRSVRQVSEILRSRGVNLSPTRVSQIERAVLAKLRVLLHELRGQI